MPECSVLINENGEYDSTPTYLFDYADLYKTDPHTAGLNWFHDAHYGLGIRFGLYSLIGHGHDLLGRGGMSVLEYEKLANQFEPEHFDVMDIAEFAIANGMRYIDFTVCDADGFCLYNSQVSSFNSARSRAKRDLLAELASACEYHGLGLCLRYAHGMNWRHPHAPGSKNPAESIALDEYKDFVRDQLHELLTQYGPIAAICLEGIDMARAVGPEHFDCADLYRMIRMMQAQVLISYQQGFTGDEDYYTAVGKRPEENTDNDLKGYILSDIQKPLEIRESITPGHWGYSVEQAGRHLREEHIWEKLAQAGRDGANFLLETSLMPDGSLDLEDITTLLNVGKRIEKDGFPH